MAEAVRDGFSGLANNEDITGRTPDTTNTPGGVWKTTGANRITGDGAGAIKFSAANDHCRIDGGSVDMAVSAVINLGGADNRIALAARGSDADRSSGSSYSGYEAVLQSGASRVRVNKVEAVGGATTLTDISDTIDQGADIEWTFQVEGTGPVTLKVFKDGVQIGSDIIDSTDVIDGTTSGGQFAGLIHYLRSSADGRADDFVIDDLVTSTDATATATGVEGTGQIGAVTVKLDATVSPTGVSGSGQVGTVTVCTGTNATAEPTGVSATGQVGTVAVTLDSTAAVTGVSGTGAVGTVVIALDSTVSPTGVSGTGSVGSVTAVTATGPVATPTGVSGTGQVGTVTVALSPTVSVSGVQGTGKIGTITLLGWFDAPAASGTWAEEGAANDVWTEVPKASGEWT